MQSRRQPRRVFRREHTFGLSRITCARRQACVTALPMTTGGDQNPTDAQGAQPRPRALVSPAASVQLCGASPPPSLPPFPRPPQPGLGRGGGTCPASTAHTAPCPGPSGSSRRGAQSTLMCRSQRSCGEGPGAGGGHRGVTAQQLREGASAGPGGQQPTADSRRPLHSGESSRMRASVRSALPCQPSACSTSGRGKPPHGPISRRWEQTRHSR